MTHSIPGVSERTFDVWFGLHLSGGTLESRRVFTEKWLTDRGCPHVEIKALFEYMDSRGVVAKHALERLDAVYAGVAVELDPKVRTRLMRGVLGL